MAAPERLSFDDAVTALSLAWRRGDQQAIADARTALERAHANAIDRAVATEVRASRAAEREPEPLNEAADALERTSFAERFMVARWLRDRGDAPAPAPVATPDPSKEE